MFIARICSTSMLCKLYPAAEIQFRLCSGNCHLEGRKSKAWKWNVFKQNPRKETMKQKLLLIQLRENKTRQTQKLTLLTKQLYSSAKCEQRGKTLLFSFKYNLKDDFLKKKLFKLVLKKEQKCWMLNYKRSKFSSICPA